MLSSFHLADVDLVLVMSKSWEFEWVQLKFRWEIELFIIKRFEIRCSPCSKNQKDSPDDFVICWEKFSTSMSYLKRDPKICARRFQGNFFLRKLESHRDRSSGVLSLSQGKNGYTMAQKTWNTTWKHNVDERSHEMGGGEGHSYTTYLLMLCFSSFI